MKSSTRLDSAVFQLTPTRTRCDLVISANGKTEKIASGLLNPFLAHLKAARDQMAKGGYSLILEPEAGCNATWFTKATVERFVRFVSTPEVLERVYTLESEIMQIEEAITIQSNNDMGLQTVEGRQAKRAEVAEAVKPVVDVHEDKAIILYKPDSHLPEANGSKGEEGNSKVQLLKVLETRRTVLQKEQGMAFARAVAAGFDIDLLTPLMSFAESFGASRLMDACTKFIELWKRKHENGQWVEIEEAEAISGLLEYANMDASGIMITDMVNTSKVALPESSNGMALKENGKACATAVNADDKSPLNQHVLPPGYPEYFQGQFPHMFPPWPMHSPPGSPVGFQPYPMPYFQNYPGGSPYFQQGSPPVGDPQFHSGQKARQRRHHMRRNSDTGIIASDLDGFNGRSSDDIEQEDQISESESKKKGGRSKKKQGVVVIRNINYIAKQKHDSLDGASHSGSDPETDVEDGSPDMKHKHSIRSQERRQSERMSINKVTSSNQEEPSYGNDSEGGHWQAFQSYLLKEADEDKQRDDKGMFSMEKEVWLKRRKNVLSDDPLASDGRDIDETAEGFSADVQRLSGTGAFVRRASHDGLLHSQKDGGSRSSTDGHLDLHSTETRGRSGYRQTDTDDFIIHRQGSSLSSSTSDQFSMNRYEGRAKFADSRSSQDIGDDSYIVSLMSTSVGGVEDGNRKGIDIQSEFPSADSKKVQVNYEPDELSMMPERATERGSSGYDPALDYEMQIEKQARAPLGKSGKEAETDPKLRSKDSKKSPTTDALGKKKNVGPVRNRKPTKLSPQDEARARAEKLRLYKADLQKLKKEKEDEQMKRLEALKLERQKRIAARSSSIPGQSPQISQQSRKQLPMKLSPSSLKGSKFSDLEPGSSSPLQRFTVRTASKTSRLTAGSSSVENRLTRSASSLPETKQDDSVAAEKKASMARIRRLSEPKSNSKNFPSSTKPRTESAKPKASDDTDNKRISAIINLDRSKAAALPELKIRAAKVPDAVKTAIVKDTLLKVNGIGSKPGTSSRDTGIKGNDDRNAHPLDDDDNPIIEKSVVTLENEKSPVPVAHALEEKLQLSNGDKNDQINEEITFPYESSAGTLVSSPRIGVAGGEPRGYRAQQHINTHELATRDQTSAKVPSISNASEKPYRAPHARVSSLEDPCTKQTEYGKALPAACLDLRTAGDQSFKAQVADTSTSELETVTDPADKSSKEPTKGFKRLLKFGRKNNTSAEKDSDVNVGGSDADEYASKLTSSTEVHTLKNLIFQEETSTTATTPKKSSRAFSLLSPFRSKNSEKKHMA